MLIHTYIILIILHKEFQLSEDRGNFKTCIYKEHPWQIRSGVFSWKTFTFITPLLPKVWKWQQQMEI
jgi:hypothetical protein